MAVSGIQRRSCPTQWGRTFRAAEAGGDRGRANLVSGSGFRVSGFRVSSLGFGVRISDSGFRVFGFGGFGFSGFRVFGLGVWGFDFRVSGFEFRVSGFGFSGSGFGFWVSGFQFWASGFKYRARDSEVDAPPLAFPAQSHGSDTESYCDHSSTPSSTNAD